MYRPFLSLAEAEQVLNEDREANGERLELAAALSAAKKVRGGPGGRPESSRHVRMNFASTGNLAMDLREAAARASKSATQYFFNYNTVESCLLCCAVLVNLSGIMFGSGQFAGDFYKKEQEAVTWIVLLIIFTSIVYYLTVVFFEMFPRCNVMHRCQACAPALLGAPPGKDAGKDAGRARGGSDSRGRGQSGMDMEMSTGPSGRGAALSMQLAMAMSSGGDGDVEMTLNPLSSSFKVLPAAACLPACIPVAFCLLPACAYCALHTITKRLRCPR